MKTHNQRANGPIGCRTNLVPKTLFPSFRGGAKAREKHPWDEVAIDSPDGVVWQSRQVLGALRRVLGADGKRETLREKNNV